MYFVCSVYSNSLQSIKYIVRLIRQKKRSIVLAVNYSTLRNNLKMYCDKATEESEKGEYLQ